MNQDTASFILTNLRERAEKSSSSVELTTLELTALQVLFGEPARQAVSGKDKGEADVPAVGNLEDSPGPVLQWTLPKDLRSDLVLCLDFGTSLSKAYACKTSDSDDIPVLIDITLVESDDDTKRHLLPSELFVHEDHLYFGMAARRKFEIVEADQDRLIDSPKQYMTLGTEVANLHQTPLRVEQDPTQSLSQRDALVLYLA